MRLRTKKLVGAMVATVLLVLPAAGGFAQTDAPADQSGEAERANECFPSCRSGYVCHRGECVSACNPPCPSGKTCTDAGRCVSERDSSAAPAPEKQEEVEQARPRERQDEPDATSSPEPESDAQDQEAGVEATDTEVETAPDSTTTFNFNSLGVLQLGLDPGVEFGRQTTVRVFGRAMNTGALSYVIIGSPSGDDIFGFGAGLGVTVRQYFDKSGPQRGFFAGGGLEYAYTQVEDSVDDEAIWNDHVVVPEFMLGYRWVFDDFLLGVGAAGGAALYAATNYKPSEVDGCTYDSSCTEPDPGEVAGGYGFLMLELGWFL